MPDEPRFSTSTLESATGLTAAEAQARLQRDGCNELPSAKPRPLVAIAWDVVREPMFLLLLACGAIYLWLGDKLEALMLLGFVFIIMGITFVQQRKTERALDALKNLSSPRALVIRDGEQCRIAGRDVVVGDLVVLAEGDRIPADGILLSSLNLTVDESLLTGESMAVNKTAAVNSETASALTDTVPPPGGEDTGYVYSGALVAQGNGIAKILATGRNTAMGAIAKSLASLTTEPTRLQREIKRVVARVAWFGFALSAIIAVVYGISRAHWLEGFLVGITFAMAILPEELPVVLTLFLGLGAWRIAQKNVLTRRVPAVEMLGATTVLCVDKTGTLTENRMVLCALFTNDRYYDIAAQPKAELPEHFHRLLEFSVLASHRDPYDPMERAIHNALQEKLADTEHVHGDWELVEEYPLSKELLAMSRVWQSVERESYVIAAKGAPEAIADLCHLDAAAAEKLFQQVETMAAQGLRVLGVARAQFQHTALPALQHDFEFELLGIIGLADPVRAGVPAAIAECKSAGIRVVMITGDHPATALNIAQQIGLDTRAGVMTGSALRELNATQLHDPLKTVNVFCRVAPEQKLQLVQALKANGEVVAMTGDGVNDAPALKAAHIGIAMGARGTDVAREAADLVLMDDDFSSIVAAVKLGRRIFDNLTKAASFIIAVHVPIVGMSLLPVLLGWPLFFMPVHILFLQLIIDPACSIVFEMEPSEKEVMRRPPRSTDASLFSRRVTIFSALQGLLLLGIVFAIFSVSLHIGGSENAARAMTFIALVIANLGLIFSNRSPDKNLLAMLRTPNTMVWWVTGAALFLLTLVMWVPWLRKLFYFEFPGVPGLLLSALAGCASIAVFELIKWVRKKNSQGAPMRAV